MYQRHAFQFKEQQPDFGDAYQHLLSSRANELKLQGLDDNQIHHTIKAEEQQLALTSFQQNINPAARIYDLAKARGYAPKKAAKEAAKPAPVADDPVVEEKKKAAALNTNRGNPPKSAVTDKELANMSGANFDKHWEKLFGAENKRFV